VSEARRHLGSRGELLAAASYVVRGHRILGRGVKTPLAEVDLVCRRGRQLVVVEVKRRRQAPRGVPWVSANQTERLYAAAEWLRRRERWAQSVRVELVTIEGWRLRHRGVL
jgi:putative endonuclease